MIRQWQKEQAIRLYSEGLLTMKDIMKVTRIGSPRSIYKILKEAGITVRTPKVPNITESITISIDPETAEIIKKANPDNLSEWICNMIKKTAE